jgi:hypothetical protein
MKRIRHVIALVLLGISGCRQYPTTMVHDAESGMQWHWPHFLDGKPTILAFWSTESAECLYAIDGLNTLSRREVPVKLISVATGPDIEEIHAWIDGRRGTPIRFPVLLDQKRDLARAVGVTYYPTYVYFDAGGDEIDRSYRIDNIQKWLNTRWLQRSGASGRDTAPP